MSLYRKKPVTVFATQWFKNGDHPLDWVDDKTRVNQYEGKLVRFFRAPNMDSSQACKQCGDTMHVHGWIDTQEGGHIVCPGDWIITGVVGGHYSCKPAVFEATYEVAL